jgi:hypothetical protein
MYRSCIFCSAPLGSNDSLERFPVGRNLAFDGEKGRLWAVCPRCARWNLAPIEERWEAIEDAERLFHDCRLRVQRENIGLAKLRDGTRLVRVGEALQGELAAWRYGREMRRRLLRTRFGHAVDAALSLVPVAGLLLGPVAFAVTSPAHFCNPWYRELDKYRRADRVAYRVPASLSPTGNAVYLRWRDLRLVRTGLGDGGQLELEVSQARGMGTVGSRVVLDGRAAAGVLGKVLVQINGAGARQGKLHRAVDAIAAQGGAEAFLKRTAAEGYGLEVPGLEYGGMFAAFAPSSHGVLERAREERARPPRPLHGYGDVAIALEMALHDETERRALEGELAMLQGMWRDAEEIASIADRLPDLPAPDPPRFVPGG